MSAIGDERWFELDKETLEVLFVADDEALAELYRLKLELDGYRVRVVSREQARSICRPPPGLVFLDLKTVDRETPMFLSDLRSNALTEAIPFVVLTEYREDELRGLGVRLGARDYVLRVPRSYEICGVSPH
jgi:DNA-binding response OmpR family regulator